MENNIPSDNYEERFGKSKKEVISYISSLDSDKPLHDIKIVQAKIGTKADTYFVYEKATSDGSFFPKYVFKMYRESAQDITGKDGKEDNLTRSTLEKSVLAVSDKHFKPASYNFANGNMVGLYPPSHKPFSKQVIVLDVISHDSLDTEIKEASSEQEKLRISENALNPLILHHWPFASHRAKLEELFHHPLMQLIPGEYTNNFLTYLELIYGKPPSEWPRGAEINLRNFERLAKYLVSDSTVIKSNCYPWENKIISLIDAGGVKIGSPAIDLGCSFCHPRVYNSFKYPEASIRYVAEKYIEKEHIYADESGEKIGKNLPDLSVDELEKAIYIGGLFGNLRLAAGYIFYRDISPAKIQDLTDILTCIEQQTDILAKRDKRARAIAAGLAQLKLIKEKDALHTFLQGVSTATNVFGKGLKEAWSIWRNKLPMF